MANQKARGLPDRAALHEVALRHLARYAATQAGLIRVLDRHISRAVRETGEDGQAAYAAARVVARDLAGSGAVDDAAFAETRTRRLVRAGQSRRAVASHLASKGVDAEVAGAVLPQDDVPAALAFLCRRRFGPFRTGSAGPADRQRELGALARAGFGRDVAERALRTDPDEAERVLLALKQG